MSDIEFELKKRFARLRAEDEANASTFEAVRNRGLGDVELAAVQVPRRRWIAPALLAAAAAGVMGVWATTRSVLPGDLYRPAARSLDSSANLFRWTMPTDGLLESARHTLQTPALSASVLDAAAVPIPGIPFKGD